MALDEQYFISQAALRVMVPTDICPGQQRHLFAFAPWLQEAE